MQRQSVVLIVDYDDIISMIVLIVAYKLFARMFEKNCYAQRKGGKAEKKSHQLQPRQTNIICQERSIDFVTQTQETCESKIHKKEEEVMETSPLSLAGDASINRWLQSNGKRGQWRAGKYNFKRTLANSEQDEEVGPRESLGAQIELSTPCRQHEVQAMPPLAVCLYT